MVNWFATSLNLKCEIDGEEVGTQGDVAYVLDSQVTFIKRRNPVLQRDCFYLWLLGDHGVGHETF
jgi:hypothetical protein